MDPTERLDPTQGPAPGGAGRDAFETPEWYDRSINWAARLGRELPLLSEVFGPPGEGGILDAGCGPGRQAVALAERGYRVTAVDLSRPMVDLAARLAAERGVALRLACCGLQELGDHLAGGLDGVYCIGNSLAAVGSARAVERAVHGFAAVLRPGGHLFVQVLNFPPMRRESPCVRGPRVTRVGNVEYVSSRCFHFAEDVAAGPQGRAEVTNVTHWHDQKWQQAAQSGSIYPVTREELSTWCDAAGLGIVRTLGAYDQAAFDADTSTDLLLVARRTG